MYTAVALFCLITDGPANRCFLCRQLDRSIQLQHLVCQRAQLQLTCYRWLHEDILTNSGHPSNSMPRASLMTDLKKVSQNFPLSVKENLKFKKKNDDFIKYS
jgi:hypothetical protein